VHFLPHEVSDLQPTLDFMIREGNRGGKAHYWHLRYVLLLWLSLICRIPFDLALFDEGNGRLATSEMLLSAGDQWLDRTGLERFAAAILLSRLYMRSASIRGPKYAAEPWASERT
jgi:hypothetical protein